MSVTIPTVDDFADTTVMRVIRKIVDYIRTDLVPSINDNDIEDVTFTLASNDNLTITLKKGDNSKITRTVSLTKFADTDQIADLQKQISDIKPTVRINGNILTVSVNGTSSSATLPSGGDVDIATNTNVGIVKGNNNGPIIIKSDGTVTIGSNGTTPLCALGRNSISIENNELSVSGTYFDTFFNANTTIELTSDDNKIVKNVTGSISANNLTIGVNGVNSRPIALPGRVTKYNTKSSYISHMSIGDIVAIEHSTTNTGLSFSGVAIHSTSSNTVFVGGGEFIDSEGTVTNIAQCSISSSNIIFLSWINLGSPGPAPIGDSTITGEPNTIVAIHFQ